MKAVPTGKAIMAFSVITTIILLYILFALLFKFQKAILLNVNLLSSQNQQSTSEVGTQSVNDQPLPEKVEEEVKEKAEEVAGEIITKAAAQEEAKNAEGFGMFGARVQDKVKNSFIDKVNNNLTEYPRPLNKLESKIMMGACGVGILLQFILFWLGFAMSKGEMKE